MEKPFLVDYKLSGRCLAVIGLQWCRVAAQKNTEPLRLSVNNHLHEMLPAVLLTFFQSLSNGKLA